MPRWTIRRCRQTSERRCRRCGTGCTSCRCTGRAKSARTATPSAAASCRRCRCRDACGRAASSSSARRYASATRSSARRPSTTSRPRKAAPASSCSSRCATKCAATAPPSPRIVEFHDIVYRDAKRPGDVEPPPQRAETDAAWQREIVPDDVLLFRYSALTFNGHRIHYDRKYVTEVEGYPGPDRARPADRDAADGPGATQPARRPMSRRSASRPCGRRST